MCNCPSGITCIVFTSLISKRRSEHQVVIAWKKIGVISSVDTILVVVFVFVFYKAANRAVDFIEIHMSIYTSRMMQTVSGIDAIVIYG